MKECTKNLFAKLAGLTNAKCQQCPGTTEYRCCDKMFCQMNRIISEKRGVSLPEAPGVGGIPFMGEKGCVLSPDQRPYCTGYVCPPHFGDREFRREYDRVLAKIARDPAAPPMPGN